MPFGKACESQRASRLAICLYHLREQVCLAKLGTQLRSGRAVRNSPSKDSPFPERHCRGQVASEAPQKVLGAW